MKKNLQGFYSFDFFGINGDISIKALYYPEAEYWAKNLLGRRTLPPLVGVTKPGTTKNIMEILSPSQLN